jgi:hypothetical protein
VSAFSNFEGIVYTLYTYKVINKPRSPAEDDQTVPATRVWYAGTHHKAVAAKHIVLPTFIGSRSTLNGKPSMRASIRIPKQSPRKVPVIQSDHVEVTTKVCPMTKSTAGMSVSSGVGRRRARSCSRITLR